MSDLLAVELGLAADAGPLGQGETEIMADILSAGAATVATVIWSMVAMVVSG